MDIKKNILNDITNTKKRNFNQISDHNGSMNETPGSKRHKLNNNNLNDFNNLNNIENINNITNDANINTNNTMNFFLLSRRG